MEEEFKKKERDFDLEAKLLSKRVRKEKLVTVLKKLKRLIRFE